MARCPVCGKNFAFWQADLLGTNVCDACKPQFEQMKQEEQKQRLLALEKEQQESTKHALEEQVRATRAFQMSDGRKELKYRVYRMGIGETWETIFDRATQFANSLAPEALVNVSHSGGEGIGTFAVAVWYWERIPND